MLARMTIQARGYAALDARTPLVPFAFERRAPGPNDVRIQILYCGICHTDLHHSRNDWGSAVYPLVPGHEIVGRVVEVGAAVTRFRVGDAAGVGCMVDSCRECASCREGLEQYCEQVATWTYNGKDRVTGARTFGGYSDTIVVDDRFVVKIPASMDLAATAPLFCAGITTYSPLRHWKVSSVDVQRVGIIGLGGLGHMGVRFAKALGAEVTVITTSAAKAEDAHRLGADAVLLSTDAAQLARAKRSFDLLLDTIPVGHDLAPYLSLLARDRALVLVGAMTELAPAFKGNLLVHARRSVAGSLMGGLAETQEMIDFSAARGIVSDVEVIPIQQINQAYERMLKGDVRYRFVIDMASLAK
jgi:uncharacterized zinc-type alcohol dehydrogenase-like protein